MCKRVCLCSCVKVRLFATPAAAKRKSKKLHSRRQLKYNPLICHINFIFEHLYGMRNEEVEIQSGFEIFVKKCVGGNGKFIHSFNGCQNKSNQQWKKEKCMRSRSARENLFVHLKAATLSSKGIFASNM